MSRRITASIHIRIKTKLNINIDIDITIGDLKDSNINYEMR